MLVRYLKNPHTGQILQLQQFNIGNEDWIWERGIAGFYLHEFEQNSPEHTLFILRNFDRLHNNDIENWT